MIKLIKNNFLSLVLIIIQGYFFITKYLDSQMDYELHFLTWAVIWFACFFFSRKSGSSLNSGLGMGASRNDPITYAMINKTEVKYPNATDDIISKKLTAFINFYLLLSVFNVIAYIITVIILY